MDVRTKVGGGSNTIVIADDHDCVRYAISAYAADHAGFEVVAAVPDAQTAIAVCAAHQPSLLVLDIDMPGRDPLSAVSDVRAASPGTKVVALAARCSDAVVAHVIRARAHGCLLKSDSLDSIFNALARIARGERVYSPDILSRLPSGDSKQCDGLIASLTPRELEVLRYIGRGYSNDQMAGTMSLSKRTVERHVARLMDALAIRERSSLQRFAVEHDVAC